MATRTVVCPECGAEVPAGRLSCAACGTLLASVAGASRRAVAPGPGADGAAGGSPATPGDVVDAASAASLSARGAAAAAWTTGMDAAEDPLVPPILQAWTGPMPVGVVTPTLAPAAPEPAPATWTPPAWTTPPQAASQRAAPERQDADDSDAWDTRPHDAILDGGGASVPPLPEPGAEPSWPSGPNLPGAYVAPSIVPTAAATVNGRPATATSIAAVAVAEGTITSVPAQPRPDRWFSVPAPANDDSAPGRAGIFSDLPLRTPKDLPSWAVAVGSLIGALAFLLPWSANGVYGAGVDQSFTGQWGLANPASLVPMAAAIVVLFLTLIPNRIPASIRGVALPILIGGLFLGIFWSYLTGFYGLGLGVDTLAVGGIVLIVGGALAAARADDPPKPARQPDKA